MRTEFVGGGPGSEQYFYYTSGPEGRPMAGYSFDLATGLTSQVWRAQHRPFGELLSETTSDAARYRPPWMFAGQITLEGSEVGWWQSGVWRSRQALQLNRWRAYDPRVGQYLQPEPMLVEGALGLAHPYGYALLGPLDYVDPSGREPGALAATLAGWFGGGGAGTATAAGAGAGTVVVAGPPAWLLIGLGAGLGLSIGYFIDQVPQMSQGLRIQYVALNTPDNVCLPYGTWANDRAEPMPTDEECQREWEDAYEEFERLIAEWFYPGRGRGITGPYDIPPSPYDCARGLVTEACGGNPVEF
jgi:RHS repeat-associated protein